MEELENTRNEVEKPLRDEYGRLLPNQKSLNPAGRPAGSKNFSTLFTEALKQIADKNKQTPEQVELDIINIGIVKALKGNFFFWDSLLNRKHGKPVNKIGLDDELEELEIKIIRTKDEIPDVINDSLAEDA